MKKAQPNDPLLDEVEAAQRRVEAEYGNDPSKLLASYLEEQEQHVDRLIRRPKSGDPLLDEVDEARQAILEECGGDPDKVLESYLEYQKQFGDRLVNYHGLRRPGKSAA
jgi:hypothetical protein